MEIDESYKSSINYAASLYELREYEQAKNIFIDLLKIYPNRMWLMLCIAYCELHIGNKKVSISYIEKVKHGQDVNYDLNTDYISVYQIFDVYYALEDYDKFLSYCDEEVESNCYTADWEHLFYALWIRNKIERFTKLEEKNRLYFEETIKEAIDDDYYESDEERQETIDNWKKDKEEFEKMISNIKDKGLKPKIELKLYPEYSCFLVDCIRHKF